VTAEEMTSPRRVAVVGGGLMGVTLSLRLAAQGYAVTLLEADDRLGGLSTWEDFGSFVWDRFYHCILPTDSDLIGFLRELGLSDELLWTRTSTGVYIDGRTYPLDTALDFARFSALTLLERARLAWTLVRCALVRDVGRLEGTTAEEWFVRVGGLRPYERIWLPLLRAKFGEAADRVSPVFLVAKVKRMLTARKDVTGTENLGHVRGGYLTVWERAAQALAEAGVDVRLGTRVVGVDSAGDGAVVRTADGSTAAFERVALTVPFQAAREMTRGWPGGSPVSSLAGVEYMGLVCLILALKREVVHDYVTNVADSGFPFTGVICMTNLIDPAEVGGLSLVYVPHYVPSSDPALTTSDDEVFAEALPALQRIYPDLSRDDIAAWFVRRAEIVQPVQGIGYSHSAPQPRVSGPLTMVNNAQLLETDLNNGKVVEHATLAAAAIARADGLAATGRPPARRAASARADATPTATRPAPAVVRFVVPARSTAPVLRGLLARIAAVMRAEDRACHVYVVADGGPDDARVATEGLLATGELTLLAHDGEPGIGAALAAGLRRAAADSGAGDVVVTLDADFPEDPRWVPRLVERYMEGPDVVIASRFQPGSIVVGESLSRRALTNGARLFYGSLVPVPGVRDYSCGYRLYSSQVLEDAFARLGDRFITERGFACMVEILANLRGHASFGEVPFVLRYDEAPQRETVPLLPTVAAYLRVIRRSRAR
jgi:protoporphyrinogen oxidase